MQLRGYQTDAIEQIRDAIRRGKRRIMVMAPTGAGKTVISGEIIAMARQKKRRVAFTVPSLTLIDQTVERFGRHGIRSIGVMQSMHELTDPSQPVQVCSVQTLARRGVPMVDLAIVDEAHIQFDLYRRWFDDPSWKDIPIIGLSATPWAKGMGKLWDELIIVTTTRQLIDSGDLSKFRVFAHGHPDLSGVKTVRGDYDQDQLGEVMNKTKLVADIVSTWLEKADKRRTLCFCVNRLHAKAVQQQFLQAGVRAEYCDAFTTPIERDQMGERFNRGEIDVVCNVGVLTTGVDWDVRCIILARPTKSEMLYVQIVGRGLRTADDKYDCLILDHSDTTLNLGFVTDIHHDTLDDGSRKRAKPLGPPLPKECPQCHALRPPKIMKCESCGFEVTPTNTVWTRQGELVEINDKGGHKSAESSVFSMVQREQFFRELVRYARDHKYRDGWAFWAYQDKFGIKPASQFNRSPANDISPATMSWITHRNIVLAKRRMKSRGAQGVQRDGNSSGAS